MSATDGARDLNLPPLKIAVAAKVAINVERLAATIAIEKELNAAFLNFALSGPMKTSIYHCQDQPPQAAIDAEALKE